MIAESWVALRWSLLVVTFYLVQIGFLVDFSLFGVHPEILLLVAIAAGLIGGPARGAIVGFAAGLAIDMLLPGALGISALSYALVGFAVGAVEDSVIRSSRLISATIAGAASAAGMLLYAMLGQLLGQRTLSDPHLWRIIGIVAAFNAALCVPVVAVCRWAERSDLRTGVR